MDSLGLSAKDVSVRLHVEEQTIRNWRSSGVPSRRLPHVRNIMAEWGNPPSPDLEQFRQQTLVVRVTPEQFRRWESATRASGEDHVEDWARNSLEEIARENKPLPFQAAEDGAALETKKGVGGKKSAGITSPPPVPESHLPTG